LEVVDMALPSYVRTAKIEGDLLGATIAWEWAWSENSVPPNVIPAGQYCIVTNQSIENKPAVPPNQGQLTLTPSVTCGSETVVLDPITLTVGVNFVEPAPPCCFGAPPSCELFWEDCYLCNEWTQEWAGGYANYTYIYRAKLLSAPDGADVTWRFVFNDEEIPVISNGNVAEVHTPMDTGHGDLYATYMGVECGPISMDLVYGS
jgi:hypothetical protein